MQMKPASFDIETNKEISLVDMAPLAVTTKQRPNVVIIVPSSKGRKYVQIEIPHLRNLSLLKNSILSNYLQQFQQWKQRIS